MTDLTNKIFRNKDNLKCFKETLIIPCVRCWTNKYNFFVISVETINIYVSVLYNFQKGNRNLWGVNQKSNEKYSLIIIINIPYRSKRIFMYIQYIYYFSFFYENCIKIILCCFALEKPLCLYYIVLNLLIQAIYLSKFDNKINIDEHET